MFVFVPNQSKLQLSFLLSDFIPEWMSNACTLLFVAYSCFQSLLPHCYPSFLSSLQCTIWFVQLWVFAHFSSFLNTTRSSRSLPNLPIFWAREIHFVPSLSGAPSLHGLKYDGAVWVGTCKNTSSLETRPHYPPLGWLKAAHQPITQPYWSTQRSAGRVRCWAWKGSGKINQNKCPPWHSCLPPAFGLLLGGMDLAPSWWSS